MASKRRLRRKGCEGKRRFPNFETAIRAARSYERTFKEPMNAYKCRFGNHYHIGHRMRGMLQFFQQKRGAHD